MFASTMTSIFEVYWYFKLRENVSNLKTFKAIKSKLSFLSKFKTEVYIFRYAIRPTGTIYVILMTRDIRNTLCSCDICMINLRQSRKLINLEPII